MTTGSLPVTRVARALRTRLREAGATSATGALPSQRTRESASADDHGTRTQRPVGLGVASRRPETTHSGRSGLAVLIVTSEAPPVVSGISKTVAMLHRGLTEQGNDVDIISREDFPRFIRGEMRFSAFAFYWPSLRRRLADYDVVNLHGPVPTISEVFLLLTRTMRQKRRPAVVYTHHSDLSISSLERLCSVYNELAGRVAHSADAIVVSSNAYDRKMSRPAGKPVSVIPWAIESSVDRKTVAAKQVSSRLRVLFVGQLRSYKGLHVLLDAVYDLPQVSVTIVGSGPLLGELEQRLAGPGLSNVTLAGRLPDDELHKAYETHEVVVLPSITTAEAYGLVLAEGMAAGCIPVASNLPGVSELAAETGILAPPGSAEGLRSALLTLAEDRELRQRLSAASLARARRLSVESMATEYARVFQSAVETTGEQRAAEVVPDRWVSPRHLLADLAETIGPLHSSLSHVPRSSPTPEVEVWLRGGVSYRSLSPAARFMSELGRPVLLTPGLWLDRRLRPLLHRPDSTSSILLPVHWTKQGTSVVEIWTTPDDDIVLGPAELSRLLSFFSAPVASAIA
jgi:glycosyltransferase involved in cell wall biosynthesis